MRDEWGGLAFERTWKEDGVVKKVSFSVAGSTIYDIVTANCDNVGAAAEWGQVVGRIGISLARALQAGDLKLFDAKFSFQQLQFQARPSKLQALLAGSSLVVVDFPALGKEQPACPKCGSNSDVQGHGYVFRAHGDGVQTQFITSRRRLCTAGDKHADGQPAVFSDEEVLQQLPPQLTILLSEHRQGSGLQRHVGGMLLSLQSQDQAHPAAITAIHEALASAQAARELAYLQTAVSDPKVPLFDFESEEAASSSWLQHTMDVYGTSVAQKQRQYYSDWQKCMGGCGIVSLDAGCQVVASGMTTLMSGDGYILGCWLGSSDLWLLSPYVAAVGARGYTLKQPVVLAYARDPIHSHQALKACFPLLGLNLFPGDAGVRGDVQELVYRLKASCSPGHPSWPAAETELLQVFMREREQDSEAGHVKVVGAGALEPAVRYLVPPPHQLLPDFKAWATKWLGQGVDEGCVCLFTLETVSLVESTFQAIISWYYSDPWSYVGSVCSPVDLYKKLLGQTHKRPKPDSPPIQHYASMRGTARHEDWWRSSGVALKAAAGAGGGQAPASKQQVAHAMEQRVGNWNWSNHVGLGKMEDHQARLDPATLASIGRLQQQLGLPSSRYADVPDPSSLPKGGSAEEGQVLGWQQDLASRHLQLPQGQLVPTCTKQLQPEQLAVITGEAFRVAKREATSFKLPVLQEVPPEWQGYNPAMHLQPTQAPSRSEWVPAGLLQSLEQVLSSGAPPPQQTEEEGVGEGLPVDLQGLQEGPGAEGAAGPAAADSSSFMTLVFEEEEEEEAEKENQEQPGGEPEGWDGAVQGILLLAGMNAEGAEGGDGSTSAAAEAEAILAAAVAAAGAGVPAKPEPQDEAGPPGPGSAVTRAALAAAVAGTNPAASLGALLAAADGKYCCQLCSFYLGQMRLKRLCSNQGAGGCPAQQLGYSAPQLKRNVARSHKESAKSLLGRGQKLGIKPGDMKGPYC